MAESAYEMAYRIAETLLVDASEETADDITSSCLDCGEPSWGIAFLLRDRINRGIPTDTALLSPFRALLKDDDYTAMAIDEALAVA